VRTEGIEPSFPARKGQRPILDDMRVFVVGKGGLEPPSLGITPVH
jgi:hypothetical protein